MQHQQTLEENLLADGSKTPLSSRRKFLATAGSLTLASALVLGSCKKKDDMMATSVDLGSGDVGILNYAYALEQLEAAFYIQVVASPYSGISAAELAIMADIRDHEIAHREFFKNALGSNAIGNLEVNFSSINFTNRASVLATAKAFEDLGVSAYNGAGQLISDVNNLVLAGKIVSVEARHAAIIRNLITAGSFADSTVIDANGLEMSKSPTEVLAIASSFIKTSVTANNLPR